MHALLRLGREVLLDLVGVVHVQIPVFFLYIGDELVQWLHLSQIHHRPHNHELALNVTEGGVKAPDFLKIGLLAVMLHTRDYQDLLSHFGGLAETHNFYSFANLAHCGLLL
jgi:hypothetical protein